MDKGDEKGLFEGEWKRVSFWPPAELRSLAGPLPFNPLEEIELALRTCQELDRDVVERGSKTLMGLNRFGQPSGGAVAGLFHAIHTRGRFIYQLPEGNTYLIWYELDRCQYDTQMGLAVFGSIYHDLLSGDEQEQVEQLVYSQWLRAYYVECLARLVRQTEHSV